MTSLVRAKQLVLLTNFGSCKKVGPWPTRCVHKVGSYQSSLVRARKLVILWPAWYVQNSWSSWPAPYVQESWSLANSVRAYSWFLSNQLGSCKKAGYLMTCLVRAKQLVLLTNTVRAKKLVPGQLGACIKLALIKPAWYVQESWLSYDQLGTCKTAGPLDQLRFVQKSWSLASSVRAKSWLLSKQLGTCKKAGYLILWPAWYVQNSWSSWPTWYVQKSWSLANSVRA